VPDAAKRHATEHHAVPSLEMIASA